MQQNQLALETSPYLLQHKENPVHWQAWSPEALASAKHQDKPILLSIGYAACHWCHVMAHESFEDAETASLMNENYINIKVDREERPDIDKVYMQALHALGEQGGWPLTMFLDSDARPFWGGTYFPPESRYGRPGFKHILREISRIWNYERDKVRSNSTAIVAALNKIATEPSSPAIGPAHITDAALTIADAVDPILGGLKGAPKFPQAPIFDFLWSASQHPTNPALSKAVETTLTQISQGGIYDHLGGGIARYSVDANWLVPHFEKMLSDNALYVSLLTRVWLKTQNPLFRIRIEETISFILKDMTTPQGLFASSYDADSDGHEGKYYVWSKTEIETLLGPEEAWLFCHHYDVSTAGNWEGQNILNRSKRPDLQSPQIETRLAHCRSRLRDARAMRIPPGFDNKVLADWNGLMITGLAEAALVLSRADWADAATRAMTAIMDIHWQSNRLLHASTGTSARHEAVADDYANLITAARAMHALTGAPHHLTTAAALARALIGNHWDEASGALFFAPLHNQELPVRIRTIHDDATPNANAVMMGNFTALTHLTGENTYADHAARITQSFAADALRNPFAVPSYFKHAQNGIEPIQIVATHHIDSELIVETIRNTGLDVILHRITSSHQLSDGHPASSKFISDQRPALFICKGQTCSAPARTLTELHQSLALLGLLSGVH